MKRRVREHESDDVVITFEPRRCIHAAECVKGLPEVFDVDRKPWIDPSGAAADAIVEIVERCPSGALQYRRRDDGADEAPDEHNRAVIVPDGPIYVRGDLEIVTGSGTERATRVALCRCGASKNKPYCDNSHREAGFEDAGELGDGRLVPGDGDAGGETGGGTVRLRSAANGPILVEGPLEVTSADGASSSAGVKGALCRCGESRKRPFCDGSHKRVGFEAE